MPQVIDPNRIAAETLEGLVKSAFNSVAEGASKKIANGWQKIFEDFSPLMKEMYGRNRNVRILCQKESDVDLYDVYVNSSFECGEKQLNDDELLSFIVEGNNVVINGNGGAGKTFFMRHLWLTIFSNISNVTPIFIELRRLNDLTSADLKSFIRLSISNKNALDVELFDYFCDNGRFCFILDGFDEIAKDRKSSVQDSIISFSNEFPACSFVVSSRHEKRFAGWQNFSVFHSLPFSLEQVKTLIENVPFHQQSKRLFLKRLDDDFFQENRSFLSNPLLAVMMLMTFKENMDIPRKMTSFYDQAFSTLYQWHDATKAYSREKTLDIDQFQRVFGMFSLLSYYNEMYEFTRTEIDDLVKKSCKACGVKATVDDVLVDFEEAVNLVRLDGLKYVFIHRSFQEYFSALCVVRHVPEKFDDFLPEFQRRPTDSVLAMCFELNRNLVVTSYIKPQFDALEKRLLGKTFDGRFGTIEKVGATYDYFIYRQLDDESQRRPVLSIRPNVDEEFARFVDNVWRIRGFTARGSGGYSTEITFNSSIFGLFGSPTEVPEEFGELDLNANVSVAGGELVLTLRSDSDVALTEPMSAAFQKLFASGLDRFDPIEKQLSSGVEELRHWCRKEIAGTKSRAKSVNEIFGF